MTAVAPEFHSVDCMVVFVEMKKVPSASLASRTTSTLDPSCQPGPPLIVADPAVNADIHTYSIPLVHHQVYMLLNMLTHIVPSPISTRTARHNGNVQWCNHAYIEACIPGVAMPCKGTHNLGALTNMQGLHVVLHQHDSVTAHSRRSMK